MNSDIEMQVNELFKDVPKGRWSRNPVTDGCWVSGRDPVKAQKQLACQALLAREWFAGHKPDDAPELPLTYGDREDLKTGGLSHLVAWFARSIASRDYIVEGHPLFDKYARGVMASEFAPEFIKGDAELMRRYPPCRLEGLNNAMCWVG
jgi:hypothetical protein